MVKSYSRHGESACLGLVASPVGSAIFDGTHAIVPALEDVMVWDTKRGESSTSFHATGVRSAVTCLAQSPASQGVFAVGHADGSIRIWDRPSATVTVTLDGHRKAVTALAFDATGTRLASGSQDTDIVLWDVVAETGLFRCVTPTCAPLTRQAPRSSRSGHLPRLRGRGSPALRL